MPPPLLLCIWDQYHVQPPTRWPFPVYSSARPQWGVWVTESTRTLWTRCLLLQEIKINESIRYFMIIDNWHSSCGAPAGIRFKQNRLGEETRTRGDTLKAIVGVPHLMGLGGGGFRRVCLNPDSLHNALDLLKVCICKTIFLEILLRNLGSNISKQEVKVWDMLAY